MRNWAAALLLLCCATGASAQEERHDDENPPYDVYLHMESPAPPVRTPWREAPQLEQQVWQQGWTVRVSVNTEGAVTAARVTDGPSAQRQDAIAAARQIRFRPFTSNGTPFAVEVDVPVEARPGDYLGPAERAFPETVDPATVRIRFTRSACYGSCPAYRLEISGDGAVRYHGEGFVLIGGDQSWRIPRENVDALIALMRQADFFRLDGYYIIPATHLPTYITALDIGGQRKFVLNYGYSGMGEVMSSSTMRGNWGPSMPRIVTELEQAIDRLSGVAAFVHGDETTMAVLRERGFDFSSEQGGQALAFALGNCEMALARGLLEAGAPTVATVEGERASVTPRSAVCGDAAFTETLIARAPLRCEEARDFLRNSVWAGYPALVELALRHSRDVNRRLDYNETLLMVAAEAIEPEEGWGRPREGFDRAGVVRLLLAAGADARAVSQEGDTALHRASDVDVARQLLAAGADPNVRNRNYGETPIFGSWDGPTVQVLLDAGADVRVRNHQGQTALFDVASPEVVRMLIAAGLDPNAVDEEGNTPIVTVNDEEARLALLDSGARLPTDPARVRRMISSAQRSEQTAFLARLQEHARSLGITP